MLEKVLLIILINTLLSIGYGGIMFYYDKFNPKLSTPSMFKSWLTKLLLKLPPKVFQYVHYALLDCPFCSVVWFGIVTNLIILFTFIGEYQQLYIPFALINSFTGSIIANFLLLIGTRTIQLLNEKYKIILINNVKESNK